MIRFRERLRPVRLAADLQARVRVRTWSCPGFVVELAEPHDLRVDRQTVTFPRASAVPWLLALAIGPVVYCAARAVLRRSR